MINTQSFWRVELTHGTLVLHDRRARSSQKLQDEMARNMRPGAIV